MTRYFYHVRDSKDFRDEDGTELADDPAAKNEAIIFAGEMLRDIGGAFWGGHEWRLWVVAEDGREVCQLRLSATS